MRTWSRQSRPTCVERAARRAPRRECDSPGRDHVVVRLVLLEHQPHRAHVVAGVAPVAPRVEVAEHELVARARARSRPPRARPCAAGSRPAAAATRGCRGSRSRRTGRSAGGSCATMKCAYAFATPYGVSGLERRLLGLRRLARLAEDLARGRLVEADRRVDARGSPRASTSRRRRRTRRSATGSSHDAGTNDGAARL